MPRNSRDNSLDRFIQVRILAKTYQLKPKYELLEYEKQSDRIKRNMRMIGRFDKALDELAEPYKTIFRNTFFKFDDLLWWNEFYSKTTFYRLRNEAIKSFLVAYNNNEK